MRELLMRSRALISVATGAAATAAVAIAAATDSPPERPAARAAAPKAVALAPAHRARIARASDAFAVMRRPQTADDLPPNESAANPARRALVKGKASVSSSSASMSCASSASTQSSMPARPDAAS
jgi:hypothetical protein